MAATASTPTLSGNADASAVAVKCFKARKMLLKYLDEYQGFNPATMEFDKNPGYDITPYSHFSINEVAELLATDNMHMVLKRKNGNGRAFIKFGLGNVNKLNLRNWDEEHYPQDMGDEDEMIMVFFDEVKDNIKQEVTDILKNKNKFVRVFSIDRLQFDVMQHVLVPPHRRLRKDGPEDQEFRRKFNIRSNKQIPDISRFSPVAQIIGLRPGEVCEIFRPSPTAIFSKFYRICIE